MRRKGKQGKEKEFLVHQEDRKGRIINNSEWSARKKIANVVSIAGEEFN